LADVLGDTDPWFDSWIPSHRADHDLRGQKNIIIIENKNAMAIENKNTITIENRRIPYP
jgi:hypothetical protein